MPCGLLLILESFLQSLNFLVELLVVLQPNSFQGVHSPSCEKRLVSQR